MPFAKTDDGQEIYYEVHGTTGPLLILISGYMGIADLWQPLISQLGSKYRCIAFDSRGYGRSSKPESSELYSIPRHAADLATVLKTANVLEESHILVTHSMGGNIACAYYLAHPQHVSGIIYTGTYFDGRSTSPLFNGVQGLTNGADTPSQCVEFYTRMGLAPEIALEAAKWPLYTRVNNAKALVDFAMGDNYSRITVPTVIVQGDQDFAGPVDICVEPMQKALPQCTVKLLPGVCHFPPTEATTEVKRIIEELVKKVMP